MVPGGGVEPPREVVSADFESAASASSAIPAWGGVPVESIAQELVRVLVAGWALEVWALSEEDG